MKEIKIMKLLHTLSKAEHRKLSRWLASPWCNSNRKLTVLYDLLKKNILESRKKSLTKEALYDKLYNRTFNNAILNNLLNEFYRQVLSFLFHERMQHQDFHQRNLVVYEELQNRQMGDDVLSKIETFIHNKEQHNDLEAEDYLELSAWFEDKAFALDTNSDSVAVGDGLIKANKYLDNFYALKKIRFIHEQKTRKDVLGDHIEIKIAQEAVLQLKIDHPVFDLYKLRLNRPDKIVLKDFLVFKEALKERIWRISEEYQTIFVTAALNDIVQLCFEGNVTAYPEMMAFFEWGTKNNLLLVNGFLTLSRFINFVQIATLLNRKQYIERITSDYVPLLKPTIQKDAMLWAEGHLLFARKKFSATIKHFAITDIKNSQFSIVVKTTLLKAHVMSLLNAKKSPKIFYAFCDAYAQFFRRQKTLTEERIRAYLRLMQYSRKLVKNRVVMNEAFDKPTFIEKLKTGIDAGGQVAGKKWLYETFDFFIEN